MLRYEGALTKGKCEGLETSIRARALLLATFPVRVDHNRLPKCEVLRQLTDGAGKTEDGLAGACLGGLRVYGMAHAEAGAETLASKPGDLCERSHARWRGARENAAKTAVEEATEEEEEVRRPRLPSTRPRKR